MYIKRTLPPAATPIRIRDILGGLRGLVRGQDEIERFRFELKNYFGVKHCYLVSSGKAALTIILKALHATYPGKSDVVIPAYTCYSVPASVRRAGLGIQLCDIDPETIDFNYSHLQEIINGPDSDRILAIIPRHIFGLSADIERLRRFTSGLDIAIVEDAAQVMGGEQNGKKLGTSGDAGVFSLGRGKAISTVEGGVILTDKNDLADRIKKITGNLPDYGIIGNLSLFIHAVFLLIFMHPLLFWLPKSLPMLKVGATVYDTDFAIRRFSSFQAGLACGWQSRLRSFMKTRSENAWHWISILQKNTNISRLFSGSPPVKSPDAPVRFAAWMRSVIKAKHLLQESQKKGFGIMITYPDSVDRIPELFSHVGSHYYPVAYEYARRLLTFPTHGFVSESDKKRIAKVLLEFSPRG